MKSNIGLCLFIFLILFGCEKDSNKHGSPPGIDGLSLYWDHEVFGTEGRRIRFEFYGTKQFEDSYELVFKYSINQKNISIILVNEIDNGKCPKVEPGWGNDSLCTASGRMYIPDSLISKGTYNLTLKTSSFETTSELIVGNDSIVLNIPSNKHFSSFIHAVYPIRVNLMFGSIVFSGAQNTNDANMFINDLLSLGLTKTNVPDYPYRYLSVDKNGNVEDSSWPPDNYSLGLLFTFNNNFKDIFNLAKDYFDKTNLNIYLYSSNGDEALLNKIDGVRVVYAVK
jgi:hypothetical protein